MTAYYTPVLGANGFIAPDTATILSGVCTDIQTAFGGTLNLDTRLADTSTLSTPQGQLATTLAAAIADKNNSFVYYVTQTDPQYAMGRMQDAIGKLYNMTRVQAAGTTVYCLCSGLAGTVIPANAQVQDTAGNIYSCVTGGFIPTGGNISLQFQNLVTGAIPCLANTVTQIYSSISGWVTVNNPYGTDTDPANNVIGNDVESQQAFEYRRQESMALNSVGVVQSIYAAVWASTPTPLDVYVVENPLATPATIGGVSVLANSIYVSVAGGDPQAIGEAIWAKKPPGCSYNGNTSVTVTDQNYAPPISYTVTYETPSSLPIYFTVNIKDSVFLPHTTTTAAVQDAIVAAFYGTDGGPAVHIGTPLYASRYYSTVAAVDPHVQITSMFVGVSAAPSGTYSVTPTIAQYPTTVGGNITVNFV